MARTQIEIPTILHIIETDFLSDFFLILPERKGGSASQIINPIIIGNVIWIIVIWVDAHYDIYP
jgi:hypothetical protein